MAVRCRLRWDMRTIPRHTLQISIIMRHLSRLPVDGSPLPSQTGYANDPTPQPTNSIHHHAAPTISHLPVSDGICERPHGTACKFQSPYGTYPIFPSTAVRCRLRRDMRTIPRHHQHSVNNSTTNAPIDNPEKRTLFSEVQLPSADGAKKVSLVVELRLESQLSLAAVFLAFFIFGSHGPESPARPQPGRRSEWPRGSTSSSPGMPSQARTG